MFATTEEESTTSNTIAPDNDSTNDKPVENQLVEGSEEELMYVLGVNLARQLGDVRPRKFC
jgi:hypothetical protein